MSRFPLAVVVRVAVFAALIAFIALAAEPMELLARTSSQVLLAILAVQPLVAVNTWLSAIRLSWLVGAPAPGMWKSTKAILLSSGLNLVLPSRLGELAKATYLHQHGGVRISAGLSAVVIERSLDLVILGLIALAGLALFAFEPSWAIVIAAAGVAVAVALLPALGRIGQACAELLPWRPMREFARRSIAHATERFQERAVLKAFLLGIVMWLASLINIYLFFVLCGADALGAAGAILVFLATTVGGAIPVLPGGFGTYEAGAVLVLSGYGFALADALVLAVAMHASQVLLGAIGAIVVLASERIGVTALINRLRNELRAQGSRSEA